MADFQAMANFQVGDKIIRSDDPTKLGTVVFVRGDEVVASFNDSLEVININNEEVEAAPSHESAESAVLWTIARLESYIEDQGYDDYYDDGQFDKGRLEGLREALVFIREFSERL
jgi:hypothetical protein